MRVSPLILVALSLVAGLGAFGFAAGNQEEHAQEERCGKLASAYFSKDYVEGVARNDYTDPNTHKTLYDETRSSFVGHYNNSANKCYVAIQIENSTRLEKAENSATWISLTKITGSGAVGMFHQSSPSPYADVCFIGPQSCASRSEWNALLKPYMQN
jgi:hypothetical protein